MASVARTAWELPRAPGAPARVWRDWALVSALVVLGVVETMVRPGVTEGWPPNVIQLGLIATLLWRRTHPGLMIVIASGVGTVLEAGRLSVGVHVEDYYTSGFLLILLYALVRWGSGREILLGSGVVFIGVVVTLVVGSGPVDEFFGAVAVLTASIALGVVFRYRAAARIQRIEQARLQERERLARDLHDTVAHHVSAITVQAQAGIVASAGDPTAGTDALRAIEAEARLALREMRSMVGTLRDTDGEPRTPMPGLDEVRALAAPNDAVPVTVEFEGDVDRVPAYVATALYRVAQESITNARRHAVHATNITVNAELTPTSVTLRIHNDGDVVDRRSDDGFGIVGMTERVALIGGTLTVGPDPIGGWSVEATVPLREGTP